MLLANGDGALQLLVKISQKQRNHKTHVDKVAL